MKNFFFKKALPNSASFDSTLKGRHEKFNEYQQDNHNNNNHNSIDKPQKWTTKNVQRPHTLVPIAEPPLLTTTVPCGGTSQQCHQLQTPSFDHQQLAAHHQPTSPMSCSSTQGTIGCAVGNELFEQSQTGWHYVPFDSAQSPTAAQCAQAFHNCHQPLLVPPHPPPAAGCSGAPQQQQQKQQQISELMCTLAQQLSTKDAEIERLRMALRRGREAAALERQRHADEENAAREQISRMRRRLRTYETELEYAKQQNRQTTTTTSNNEAMILDHAKLKSELAQERRAVAEREAVWHRERSELNQTVQSLNSTLEELELELRQREVHGREMQLQLERTVVERDMALMEVDKDRSQQQQKKKQCPALSLPSPNADSSGTDEYSAGGDPSLASSSGIDSAVTDANESIDAKKLRLTRRKLVECRQKVARLICSAEKTQREERLGRDDLFGSFLSVQDGTELPNTATQAQLLEDQASQIGALRKELELLHDKFIILYARGTFEK